MTSFKFPIRVAENGDVSYPETTTNPYLASWVTGAADTVPECTRRKYAKQIADLKEKLSVLKTKRARNGATPHNYAWALGGTDPLDFMNDRGDQ